MKETSNVRDARIEKLVTEQLECKTLFGRSVIARPRPAPAPLSVTAAFQTERPFLFCAPTLFFEYSGETYCDGRVADAPSPSKAHVQTWRHGVTSGAQDFENVEKFGHRYLNRADSKNHPAKDSKTSHSRATRRASRSIRNYRPQVERRCCDCANIKSRLRAGKVLFRFRFLPVRQPLIQHERA
jgi:hypothetical protein